MDMLAIPTMPDVKAMQAETTIRLFSGVPWDRTYQHVRLFDTRAELDYYLLGKLKLQHLAAAPVRIGSMDVDIPWTQMQTYNINYMSFINKPFDDKTHYAFVTGMEWLSVNSTRLFFELDVWNECQFECDFSGGCFTERTIVPVENDIPGKYTYPEGFETGEYIVRNHHTAPDGDIAKNKAVVIAATFDQNYNTAVVGGWQGSYSGVVYHVFTLDTPSDVDALNTWLKGAYDKNIQDGILNAVIVPTYFTAGYFQEETIEIPKPYSAKFGQYKPKCAKCYTYPYMFLVATDNNGTVVEYHYEDFYETSSFGDWTRSDHATFAYTVNVSSDPVLYMWPRYYRRIFNDYKDGITFGNYTKIAIATDTYRAWLAQNSAILKNAENNITYDLISNAMGAVSSTLGSLGGGNILGGISNGITGAVNTAISYQKATADLLAQKESHRLVAPGAVGAQANSLSASMQFDRIYFYEYFCQEEYIGKIDNYWWAYGYLINDFIGYDVSMRSRKYWNYVKTVGCALQGSFPVGMQEAFRGIFDNGVTIWHTDDIGNYSLNNNEEVTT